MEQAHEANHWFLETSTVIRRLVALLAIGTSIDRPTVLGLEFSAPVGLRGGDPKRIRLLVGVSPVLSLLRILPITVDLAR